ncbi:MAG: hypothetical protein WC284_18040 [Candidimonas sp.]
MASKWVGKGQCGDGTGRSCQRTAREQQEQPPNQGLVDHAPKGLGVVGRHVLNVMTATRLA